MKLSEVYRPGRFGLSYELFPPKTEQGISQLFGHLNDLVAFEPDFITCTYGAGGSTRVRPWTSSPVCETISAFPWPRI